MEQRVQNFAIALVLGLSPLLLGQLQSPEAEPLQGAIAATSTVLIAQTSTPAAPLAEGAKGPAVEALQKRLQEKGFDPGVVDGIFGAKTKTALIAYQKSKGLRPDGMADAKTLAALGLKPAAVATTTTKPAKAPVKPTTSKSAPSKSAPATPTPKPVAATPPTAPSQPTATATAKPAATPSPSAPSVVVADKYYWPGTEGNLGLKITGKFVSLEKQAAAFNLLQEVGQFRGRQWKLGDILVTADFNANGNVATWEVSGPKPLITEYVDILRKRYEDKSMFYDFSFTYVNFKPTVALEQGK